MNNFKNIKVAIDKNIAVLTFNRPDVLNAMNTETVMETFEAVCQLEKNPLTKVIIITGSGKAFVAGADISEMISKTPEDARIYSELGHKLMNSIQNMSKPVIAAVNGYALGGGTEIALSCDIRLASDKAMFGLPETTIGVMPGWGATQRASRLIGTALAKELIFTGEIITAQRALEIGLVNRIASPESLMEAAMDMAGKICRNGQVAISQAKKTINEGVDKTFQEGCAIEIEAFAYCFSTEDQKEGMNAFIEKRKPDFKGR
jgi:enoyl-CoA hydratase